MLTRLGEDISVSPAAPALPRDAQSRESTAIQTHDAHVSPPRTKTQDAPGWHARLVRLPDAMRLRATLPVGSPRVSVVIPAKNEALNLPWVFDRLPYGLHEVVLVDGGSHDATVATALWHRPDTVVVKQTRRGKGNALACGFAACTGEVIVTLDADGSADPAEIVDFVVALADGADFAKGSRFLDGGGSSDITRVRRLGNLALAFVMNRMYHTAFSDLCYGYNAFWTRCVSAFHLPPVEDSEPTAGDGFEIETLLTARAAVAQLSVIEVPSYESDRRYGHSNLNTWRDGWQVLRTIVRERRGAATRRTGRRIAPAAAPKHL